MNRLSSKARKFVYLGGIIVMLIPIIWLGMPSAQPGDLAGKLSELRTRYDLGENQLGQIDPTSAAMNLVLLGFRGIAADLIWVEACGNEETKNWAELRGNVDTIVMLQPHFVKVWDHQGWNLAYNVSAAWDLVADRYFWVKEGAKFVQKGSRINRKVAMLPYREGQIIGTKIGRADEWKFYRKFFSEKDPNEELFKGGPDREVNPEGKDNYLAAKRLYEIANDLELQYPQTVTMLRIFFRSYPYRSQFAYADALQREGLFDEVSRTAWEEGYREWVAKYGQEKFESEFGPYHLEMTAHEIEDQATTQNLDVNDFKHWVSRMRDESRYVYWKTRAQVEAAQVMVEAHKSIYDGQQSFRKGNLSAARDLLFKGMTLYQELIDKYDVLAGDFDAIEEAMMAVIYWQKAMKLQFTPIPEKYPLSGLWAKYQGLVPNLESRFKRETGQD
jgi:hypothetical protein